MNRNEQENRQDGFTKDKTEGAKERLFAQAKDVFHDAAGRAMNQVDSKKEEALGAVTSVASAIRKVGEGTGAPPIGKATERLADSIERAAGYIQDRSIGELARDLETFARREPAVFYGTALALGLIGGRFLKSSAHATMGDEPSSSAMSGTRTLSNGSKFGSNEVKDDTSSGDYASFDNRQTLENTGTRARPGSDQGAGRTQPMNAVQPTTGTSTTGTSTTGTSTTGTSTTGTSTTGTSTTGKSTSGTPVNAAFSPKPPTSSTTAGYTKPFERDEDAAKADDHDTVDGAPPWSNELANGGAVRQP